MRTYPAGWVDPSDPDQTAPDVYLHLVDSAWPPANDDDDCPAGYAKVGTWNLTADLKGSLLPGQVATPSGFASSSGSATIGQPESGRIAPWKAGDQRALIPSAVELIASHDGPLGDTAFLLGTLRVDPVSSKESDPSLSIQIIEDWVALRRPHTVVQERFGIFGGAPQPIDDPASYPYDPARIVEQIAEGTGFAYDVPEFGAELTSIYFPGNMDALTCLQQLVAAHLGAVRVTVDGTITVLTYDQLSGATVDPVDTVSVLDKLEDLEWVIDPAESYDRVEVKFTPPDYISIQDFDDETGNDYIALERAMSAWIAAPKTRIEPGHAREYVIDPGTAWSTATEVINSDTKTNGTGTSHYVLDTYEGIGALTELSTGRLVIKVQNTTGVRRWLVENDGNPSYLVTYWKDSAGTDDGVVLSWGADAASAYNPLSVDLGKMVQRTEDASVILSRIVGQVREARPYIPNVNVVPDLRRELGDIIWVDFPEEGLHTKAIITKNTIGGQDGKITQQLGLAFLGPRIRDFNDAWDLTGSPTIADWNTLWAGKTIADFNANPLDT
ncbi:hypothetical protein [Aeromicrobium sp. 9AM]|uniref:hypothetical protein n=1 Tax=Aeromicrobium sp. 9AM TaxID=2653126 RepID=UPI0012F12E76|nr:hypothetical protein [Aeromicrobium sp. 9AM]VXB81707.1 conserved hypothetical protein [Aeromicrobium sp. 9AM]